MKKNGIVILCVCFFIFTLVRYPQAMLTAGAESVVLWSNRVLPSLFPFMVACGLLLKTGAAEKFGEYLCPLMQPLFALPGIAAFPFFLGIFSGYPMGAKITAALYEEKKISLVEAEHILTFCNNPGPLFLIGTVGVAFFHAPLWGYIFLLCCFLGAFFTGILFRPFYQKQPHTIPTRYVKTAPQSFAIAFPQVIANALDTILQIGGYLILFAVATEGMKQAGVFHILQLLLSFLPFSSEFLNGLFAGLLEMTNGAFILSSAPDPLLLRLTATCGLTAFGGLSILCQTFGILAQMPIKKSRYIAAKLCNSLFSILFFCILGMPISQHLQEAAPTLAQMTAPVFTFPLHMTLSMAFFCITCLLALHQKR